MTLWQRILQGMVALTTSTGISMLTGVVSAFLTFRYLSPDAYGRLALFLTFYNTGTIFLNLGLDAIVTSEVARARGEKQWAWVRLLVGWYGGFVLTAGLALLLVFFGVGFFSPNGSLWRIMGVYLLLTAPNRLASIIFHGTSRFRRMASLTVARSVSRMMLLLTLPLWWQGDMLLGVAWTFPLLELGALLTAVFLLRTAWGEIQQPNATSQTYRWADFWALLKAQGGYVLLSLPVKTVSEQMPIWFLRVMVGETAVGFFAAAQRTYLFIFSIFRTLETTLFPLVAEQITTNAQQLRVALRQAQKYTFWGAIVVIGGSSLLAPFIIEIIAGEEYVAAVPIFRLILWHLVLFAFAQAQRPLLFAYKDQKWLFLSYLFGLIIGLIANPVAITQAGAIGSAIGYLIYIGTVVLARIYIIRQRIPDFYVPIRTVFQVESFDKQLIQTVRQRLHL